MAAFSFRHTEIQVAWQWCRITPNTGEWHFLCAEGLSRGISSQSCCCCCCCYNNSPAQCKTASPRYDFTPISFWDLVLCTSAQGRVPDDGKNHLVHPKREAKAKQGRQKKVGTLINMSFEYKMSQNRKIDLRNVSAYMM